MHKALRVKSKLNIWYIPVRSGSSSKRYDVVVMTAEDPVTVGKELPLSNCRRQVEKLHVLLRAYRLVGEYYFGDRETMLKMLKTLACWNKLNNTKSRRQ